ncbi:MAG: APC family permease [Deltaproteobacteria bacterium]|nr:MAG: APC family permease [Deltaproteobacteria bacterium]
MRSKLKVQKKLGQWLSTAICGNDITSSCLYVSAIAAYYVGALAPVVLLIVVIILNLYRKIYTEVVEALPLNGGAYNCLLNSTSKYYAALAACMTILSYIATAVISAKTAVSYLHILIPSIEVISVTVAVLALFAILNIIGIGESAIVAFIIFIFHILTLTTLCFFGIEHLTEGFETLRTNWSQVPTDWNQLFLSLFLGFSAALLGISGFESSANFVEEQKPGVFRKTLRNMWVAVLIFNPLISFLSLNLLPINEITNNKDYLLAHMGKMLAGDSFQFIIVLDAFLVLSGAVLTSYVGVTGLVRRMTLDQCLPQFLLKQNKRRGTYHRIIIGFFLLCTSILLVTQGSLLSLAGVYTISFLGVMSLFALGNILLKINRKELKRTYKAGWVTVLVGLFATLSGIVGNIIIDYKNLLFFLSYFIPTVAVVSIVYLRIRILKFIVNIENKLMDKIFIWRSMMIDKIMDITSQEVLVFTRGGNLPKLRRAFDYIIKNEDSHKVYVVYLQNKKDEKVIKDLQADLEVLNRTYPEIEIEFICREGTFGPQVVRQFSKELNIPINNMFIGAPEEKHDFTIQDLGGVRVIF